MIQSLLKDQSKKAKWTIATLAVLPFVAISTSFEIALGLGLLVIVIMLSSYGILKALKGWITDKNRFVIHLVVVALMTTIVLRLTELTLFNLYSGIGIYAGSFIANILLLEVVKPEETTFSDTFKQGVKVFVMLLIFGFTRELLSTINITLNSVIKANIGILDFLNLGRFGMTVFGQPAGGFILLGLILSIINYFVNDDKIEEVKS